MIIRICPWNCVFRHNLFNISNFQMRPPVAITQPLNKRNGRVLPKILKIDELFKPFPNGNPQSANLHSSEYAIFLRVLMGGVMAANLKLNNTLTSSLAAPDAKAQANRVALAALMAELRAEEDTIRLGGGAKAAEAQHAKGRLTARERLKLLLDEGTEFLELGLWAAHGMYARVRRRSGRRRGDRAGHASADGCA